MGTGGAPSGTGPVLMRSNHLNRDAHFVQPMLTKAAAAKMALDATFHPTIQGNVYAAPLYVDNGPGGKGIFIVVTESNNVHAVFEADGSTAWTQNVGTPAGQSGIACGTITPIGITGTPFIDLASRTLYFASVVGNATTVLKHLVHALSIDDGTERPGFPVDTTTMSFNGTVFNPTAHYQRSAVMVVGGIVYVTWGSVAGDCGDFRGWLLGIPAANPAGAKAFTTGAPGGGMWAPGGPASDGTNLFVSTGNTRTANSPSPNTWSQGEAILRFQPGPVWSGQPVDYFAPSNWFALDQGDLDLGGSGPLLVDVPGATPSALVVALGKNGTLYVLDRNNLGGIGTGDGHSGEGVESTRVATGGIIGAPASYQTASGTYVVFHGYEGVSGIGCPAGQAGDLVAVRIGPANPPSIAVAWCVDSQGQGSPMVTTTDGTSEAVVWTAGAEASQRLHGWDGDTGAVVFAGGGAADVIPNTRRLNSPIAVNGRILVAADNALYAFKSQ
jgi:hypothetical protein